jgi:hypothetical protein
MVVSNLRLGAACVIYAEETTSGKERNGKAEERTRALRFATSG